jgi:Zn-dependent M28 family amino/carboxypeptidase
MKNFRLLIGVLLIFLTAANALPQTGKDMTAMFDAAALRAHIKFLSDDMMEGRAPGSRGGELAAKYIAAQLERVGVRPANNNSFFQPVSLASVKAAPDTILSVASGSSNQSYKFGDDFVAFTGAQTENVNLDAELVFVGYGIEAPEQKWNDYKGGAEDYRGKILVMMVNDPPATAQEPNLFGGKALTYYGRWTYKFEEAARRGAAGAILIHTDESAGYGWNVVRTSNGNWRFDVARTAESKTPFLNMRAWMTNETAKKIFQQAGKDLDALRETAKSRDFKPVNLGLRAKVDLKSEVKKLDSNNVVGILEGSDARLKNEYVVYTAHWDHLGVGEPNAKGDRIYNGALDNASGTASVLEIAAALAKLPANQRPKRSVLFLFTTAEEQGLLGAEWYAQNPIVPHERVAANVNVDGTNFLGRTNDFGALGAERSTMNELVEAVAKERGLRVSPDLRPEQGYFFRSDHFPLAKVGIPAVSMRNGDDFIGKPKGWGEEQFKIYNTQHYHQPSDEFAETWDFNSIIQMTEIAMAIGLKAAAVEKLPRYNATDEFARAQPNRK